MSTHGDGPGIATTKANQKVATSIVPWTHQRNGTLSRSAYEGGAGMAQG